MYLMYVDESGDPGMSAASPTRYFMLSGLVLHELRWKTYLDQLIALKRRMKTIYGLAMHEEIHAGEFINGRIIFRNPISRNNRLRILHAVLSELRLMTDLSIVSVIVDKQRKPADYDPFETAWKLLVQRFDNTVSSRKFNGPSNADERGAIFPDLTNARKLTGLIRKLRRYNPIPNQPQHGVGYRNRPLQFVIEDPSYKDSLQSLFVQAVDVVAYFLYQRERACRFIRMKGATKYYEMLDPVLCRVVAPNDQWGVVRT